MERSQVFALFIVLAGLFALGSCVFGSQVARGENLGLPIVALLTNLIGLIASVSLAIIVRRKGGGSSGGEGEWCRAVARQT